MKSYRSKIDIWLIVLLAILFGFLILVAFFSHDLVLLLIFLPIVLLIIYTSGMVFAILLSYPIDRNRFVF